MLQSISAAHTAVPFVFHMVLALLAYPVGDVSNAPYPVPCDHMRLWARTATVVLLPVDVTSDGHNPSA